MLLKLPKMLLMNLTETENLSGVSVICYLRHRFRIFLFRRKVMLCSQDIQVFDF